MRPALPLVLAAACCLLVPVAEARPAQCSAAGVLVTDRVVLQLNLSSNTWTLDSVSSTTSNVVVVADSPLPGLAVRASQGGLSWPVPVGPFVITSLECRSDTVLTVYQVASVANGDAYLCVERVLETFPGQAFVRHSGNASLCNATRSGLIYSVSGFDLLRLNLPVQSGSSATSFRVDQWSSFPDNTPAMQMVADGVMPGKVPVQAFFGSYPSYTRGTLPVSMSWMALAQTDQLPSSSADREKLTVLTAIADDVPLRHALFGLQYNGKSRAEYWIDAPPLDDTKIHVIVTSNYETNHTLAVEDIAVFVWPPAFVGAWDGDVDDAAYATHLFHEAVISPPPPDDNYPWAQFDSWNYNQGINSENMADCASIAAKLGLEAFILDLGWATRIGEWVADPAKFPNGLSFLSRYGFRLGLHFPLAQVDLASPMPHDYAAFFTDDYFGASAVCLGHEPAREYVVAGMLAALAAANASYIVQDGEDMVKRCMRGDHTHAPGDSNYANSQMGLDELWAGILAARPDLVLENCEDGGSMMTFKTASIFHTSITTDNADSLRTRQGVFHASYVFSPRYSARYMQDDPPTSYNMRSSLFGGPLILQLRLSTYTPEQLALVQRHVDEYKRYRSFITRQQSMVVHLQAPVGMPATGGYGFDAIQSLARDQRSAVCFVYRSGLGDEPVFTLKPLRLLPDEQFNVTLVDAATWSLHTGASLAQVGLNITLSQPLSSEIVEISAVSTKLWGR
jgi:alpha-galactosidase